MYNVARNNFYENGKNSTIMTPEPVSQFLFDLVKNKIDRNGVIFDPCVGQGSLLKPFVADGFETIGIDIEPQGFPNTIKRNFIAVNKGDYQRPSLVIVNPPLLTLMKKQSFLSQKNMGEDLFCPKSASRKLLNYGVRSYPLYCLLPMDCDLTRLSIAKDGVTFRKGPILKSQRSFRCQKIFIQMFCSTVRS